mmetsp:Transcript_16653/g.43806  ORF Transcript_16653/g.43806 Transcript_16653/m.43806 type:complete len:283 (+) Transcript_16653:82-930(+)
MNRDLCEESKAEMDQPVQEMLQWIQQSPDASTEHHGQDCLVGGRRPRHPGEGAVQMTLRGAVQMALCAGQHQGAVQMALRAGQHQGRCSSRCTRCTRSSRNPLSSCCSLARRELARLPCCLPRLLGRRAEGGGRGRALGAGAGGRGQARRSRPWRRHHAAAACWARGLLQNCLSWALVLRTCLRHDSVRGRKVPSSFIIADKGQCRAVLLHGGLARCHVGSRPEIDSGAHRVAFAGPRRQRHRRRCRMDLGHLATRFYRCLPHLAGLLSVLGRHSLLVPDAG